MISCNCIPLPQICLNSIVSCTFLQDMFFQFLLELALVLKMVAMEIVRRYISCVFKDGIKNVLQF